MISLETFRRRYFMNGLSKSSIKQLRSNIKYYGPNIVFSLSDPLFSASYTLGSKESVVAAYAQSKGDYNFDQYASRYNVIETIKFYRCGNFICRK